MEYILNNLVAKRVDKDIYRFDGKQIKLWRENFPKANVLNEALNQARVEEATDLNIPKLIEVTKIENRWGIVSEFIEGKPLSELMDEHPEKEDEYLNTFIDIQLEVLSKQVPLLNRIKDKFKRKINESEILDDTTRYELLQRLDSMEDENKLCHGDFNPSNIIITESGEHYIIDWAHVTSGNASADAARTFLLFSIQGKEELANKYLEVFSKKSGISVGNIQRWIPIVAATQMMKKQDNQEFLKHWIDVVEFE